MRIAGLSHLCVWPGYHTCAYGRVTPEESDDEEGDLSHRGFTGVYERFLLRFHSLFTVIPASNLLETPLKPALNQEVMKKETFRVLIPVIPGYERFMRLLCFLPLPYWFYLGLREVSARF